MPFNKVPGRIVVVMILFVFMWLNAFPPVDGISQTYFPRTIMTYCNVYYSKHCILDFGAYSDIHEDSPPANTMAERFQVSIHLGPTRKFQGSCKFVSLRTGQIIDRKQFNQLRMPQSMVKQVEYMAIKEDRDRDLILAYRKGSTLELYSNDVNTHDITAEVDDHNNYSSNDSVYENSSNKKE